MRKSKSKTKNNAGTTWIEIPIYGSIPAGHTRDREQESAGCLTVEVKSLGIKPTVRTFAVQVEGNAMIGKHIVDGDYVILEHGVIRRHGDMVAALVTCFFSWSVPDKFGNKSRWEIPST